jgi:hypothetical protein
VVGPTRLPDYPSGLGLTQTLIGGALLLITVCALAFVILRFARLAQLNPRLLRPLRWLVLGPEDLRTNEDLVAQARERLKRIRFLQTSTTGWSGRLAGPSFERRGLPVRDAFDSAFDEIIQLEPLDLADACTLLRSRVIGVSDLFSGLAHCMAGGLARDIIRTARSMRAVASHAQGIAPGCTGLIEGDIQRKIHAFQLATGQLDGTPDTTYAYHCATILEVFTEALTTDRFSRDRLILQTLAPAKQELGTHPQLAWLMVDEFRIAWGLSPFQRREGELA